MTGAEGDEQVAFLPTSMQEKIIKQVEYYFGDFNLPRDKFLQEKVKVDEGWVPIETLLTFNRLKSLTTEVGVVAEAVNKSDLMEVSQDGKKVRRSLEKPLPESNGDRQQKLDELTVYTKGFPETTTMDDLLQFFSQYGRCLNVYMRRIPTSRKFKGSVFATFASKEEADAFLALEGLKFNELELTRCMKKEHSEEKKRQREARLAEKAHKQQQQQEAEAEAEEVVLGCLLRLSGLGESTSWESIKQALAPYAEVAFVEYNRGMPQAVVRFKQEGSAQAVASKLAAQKESLQINGHSVSATPLEGDEEAECWKKLAAAKRENRSRNKPGQRGGKARRGKGTGNRASGRGHAKRSANDPQGGPNKRPKVDDS